MFVVLVYDVNRSRIPMVHKVCKRYLYWVQNSVFEGEITKEKLKKLVSELEKIIDKNEDSILIVKFITKNSAKQIKLGLYKGSGGDFVI